MRMRTVLGLSAILPIILPLTIVLMFQWRFWGRWCTNPEDTSFMAILGLIGITMSAIIMSLNQRIIHRIDRLNAWTTSVLDGNINSKVAMQNPDDEVARLAQAVERILHDMKESYANLHKESKAGAKLLTDAISQLKESQTKVVNEERLKALEQIVRGVAHDFSEALTPIMATTDLLIAQPALVDNKERLLDSIRGIRQSAGQGRESLEHLAGFFRVRPPVRQNNVDVNHTVRAAMEEADSQWRNRTDRPAVPITLGTILEVVPAVEGNEEDLREAIVNVLTNAFEAMPNGGKVTITTRADGPAVFIEIRDTGSGMEDDVRLRAQEPFFSTKKAPHKGMGLTRATSTVRSHGGNIRIESSPGTGTRITLSLPAHTVSAESERVVGSPSSKPRQVSVIIADDDQATRDIIAFVVTKNGHRVVVTADAEQCLAKMRTTPFDVAIVDMGMPGMQGDELAAAIARSQPDTAVVMLTGFGHIMREENTIPEYVDILIPKPVTTNELLSVLERAPRVHLDNRRKRQRAVETVAAQGQSERNNTPAAPKKLSFKGED